MSKILRRPLFRGGPVDPRGTGITSGLDKPKRGLVDEPGGYAGYQFSETPFARTLGTVGQESKKIGAGIYDLMGVPLNTLSRFFTGYNPGFSGAKFFGLEEDKPDTSYFLGIPSSTKQGFEIPSMQPEKQPASPRASGAEEITTEPPSPLPLLPNEVDVSKKDLDELKKEIAGYEELLGVPKARKQMGYDALLRFAGAEGQDIKEKLTNYFREESKSPDLAQSKKEAAALLAIKGKQAKDLYSTKSMAELKDYLTKQEVLKGNLSKQVLDQFKTTTGIPSKDLTTFSQSLSGQKKAVTDVPSMDQLAQIKNKKYTGYVYSTGDKKFIIEFRNGEPVDKYDPANILPF